MAEYPIIKYAPITEALIDIRVKIKEGLGIEQLEAIHTLISEQYPEKKKQHRWESKFEFKEGESPISTTVDTAFGCIFSSVDGKQIFQARLDGFTFSRLKPYETWETFRDEAHKLWQIYKERTTPEIIRVAARYINRIEIPLPIEDFSEYLTAAPIVPEGLPQEVGSFFTRVVIHDREIDCAGIITQALEQGITPDILPIILDIDVFKQRTEGISEEEAWEILENLRHLKNKIFFSSITKKTEEIFI